MLGDVEDDEDEVANAIVQLGVETESKQAWNRRLSKDFMTDARLRFFNLVIVSIELLEVQGCSLEVEEIQIPILEPYGFPRPQKVPQNTSADRSGIAVAFASSLGMGVFRFHRG